MSWVKVKRDNVELTIPYQAFKDVYERDGFSLVQDKSTKKPLSNPSPNVNAIEEVKNEQQTTDRQYKRTSKKQVRVSN